MSGERRVKLFLTGELIIMISQLEFSLSNSAHR